MAGINQLEYVQQYHQSLNSNDITQEHGLHVSPSGDFLLNANSSPVPNLDLNNYFSREKELETLANDIAQGEFFMATITKLTAPDTDTDTSIILLTPEGQNEIMSLFIFNVTDWMTRISPVLRRVGEREEAISRIERFNRSILEIGVRLAQASSEESVLHRSREEEYLEEADHLLGMNPDNEGSEEGQPSNHEATPEQVEINSSVLSFRGGNKPEAQEADNMASPREGNIFTENLSQRWKNEAEIDGSARKQLSSFREESSEKSEKEREYVIPAQRNLSLDRGSDNTPETFLGLKEVNVKANEDGKTQTTEFQPRDYNMRLSVQSTEEFRRVPLNKDIELQLPINESAEKGVGSESYTPVRMSLDMTGQPISFARPICQISVALQTEQQFTQTPEMPSPIRILNPERQQIYPARSSTDLNFAAAHDRKEIGRESRDSYGKDGIPTAKRCGSSSTLPGGKMRCSARIRDVSDLTLWRELVTQHLELGLLGAGQTLPVIKALTGFLTCNRLELDFDYRAVFGK